MQVILTPQRVTKKITRVSDKRWQTIIISGRNAAIILLLFRGIYGDRPDVVVSNVRLFCLLFMLDWTSAIWSDKNEPVTETGTWYRGMASPYSYDYYLYIKDSFKNKSAEEAWLSKRRILYHVRFDGEDGELSEGQKTRRLKYVNL